MNRSPKIYLIHAGLVSMKPIVDSFVKDWPQAHLAHVLDDSLPDELARAGRITEGLIERFRTLGRYCVAAGADAILFTCATFGTAIDAVKRDHRIPVLKPNESLAQELGTHPGRVALLGTFADSLP